MAGASWWTVFQKATPLTVTVWASARARLSLNREVFKRRNDGVPFGHLRQIRSRKPPSHSGDHRDVTGPVFNSFKKRGLVAINHSVIFRSLE
jgi:hypothetical protein